jgi:hypothetical protein
MLEISPKRSYAGYVDEIVLRSATESDRPPLFFLVLTLKISEIIYTRP